MAYRREIYTNRNDRLKKLLKERKVKYKDLTVDNPDLDPETQLPWAFSSVSEISEICNAKRNLTEANAERFIRLALPDIRLEYLMDYDDDMTEADKILSDAAKAEYDQDKAYHALAVLLEGKGIFLSKGFMLESPSQINKDNVHDMIKEKNQYMFFKSARKIATLNQEQFDKLIMDIQKLIAVLIDRL